MTKAEQVIGRFRSLLKEINGTEPTTELCRDWAFQLADACEDLAVLVERLQRTCVCETPGD